MAFSKGKRGKNTKWTSAFANIPVGQGLPAQMHPQIIEPLVSSGGQTPPLRLNERADRKDVTFSIGFITDLYYICNVKFPNTKKRMIWREED